MGSRKVRSNIGITASSSEFPSPGRYIVQEYVEGCSLKELIYEMVTGRVSFACDTPVAIAIKHLVEIAPSPSLINSKIPPGLEQIIMKCRY